MRIFIYTFSLATVLLLSLAALPNPTIPTGHADPDVWGFFAHKRINRLAVFTLPPEMMVFYKKHIDYITEHATDPDMRRYASPWEAPRHFLDLDRYGSAPFSELPRSYLDALSQHTDVWAVLSVGDTVQVFGDQVFTRDSVAVGEKKPMVFFRWTKPPVATWKDATTLRFSAKNYKDYVARQILPAYYAEQPMLNADTLAAFLAAEGYTLKPQSVFFKERLSEHGILPWHLQKMQRDLTEAFRQRNTQRILRLSADFGHYIGDAHVPLHTTSNYNGQKTGQTGIHGFWESRVPELFADEQYDYFVGKPDYFDRPSDYFWDIVFMSHRSVDSVLQMDRMLREKTPSDRQFCPELRNQKLLLMPCRDFSAAYQTALQGMIERRMRAAIKSVASAWYTAWIDAGQPDLANMNEPVVSEQEKKEEEALKKLLEGGKILGRPEDH